MDLISKIISLCKRRGFAFPSSEIYGGLANNWDFGHYGTLLKNNIGDYWWSRFVLSRDDMVGIDASIILKPEIWEASGHTKSFTDSFVDCKICKLRKRADHLIEEKVKNRKVEGLQPEELSEIISQKKIKCPKCGNFSWTEARKFNLLFETQLGIVEGGKSKAFLRGEIAQGIFLNFKNILNTSRKRIPFGIAQQGKAFRNEITLGQFLHRTLVFDLMEFEYFIKPGEWQKTFDYWKKEIWEWSLSLGIKEENLRWREHEEFERSHYSKKTTDIEYKYPFGWKEMFGIAYRTDFDLKNHSEKSGKDLSYLDPLTKERYLPHVIEPTFGLSRLVGIVLFDSYREEKIKGKTRVFLKLDPKIAPVKVAVFPLQKDEKLQSLARKIYCILKKEMAAEYDDTGNIGQMYRRQDEIGTPFCITIDYQSLEKNDVTLRDRDSMKQERVKISELAEVLKKRINV